MRFKAPPDLLHRVKPGSWQCTVGRYAHPVVGGSVGKPRRLRGLCLSIFGLVWGLWNALATLGHPLWASDDQTENSARFRLAA